MEPSGPICLYKVGLIHPHSFKQTPKPIEYYENDQQIRLHVRCTVQVSAMAQSETWHKHFLRWKTFFLKRNKGKVVWSVQKIVK